MKVRLGSTGRDWLKSTLVVLLKPAHTAEVVCTKWIDDDGDKSYTEVLPI